MQLETRQKVPRRPGVCGQAEALLFQLYGRPGSGPKDTVNTADIVAPRRQCSLQGLHVFAREAGIGVADLSTEQPNLEDVFVAMTTETA